ncbi:MAG: tRNA/rRNA methyltransferase [Thermoplasmata archaeon]|nr:tRNA/rRNA methyltransferase [Thermoplasmata archaeon]MEA3165197.1 tRNA/rRNA methyltransferase [Thermoplasmata archaeon]
MKPPIVILVSTQHPGNAGAAARGASNFGVTDLRFVAPRGDVFGKEALDRAVHAKPLLEARQVYPDLKSALHGASLTVGTTARSAIAANRFRRKPMDVRDHLVGLGGDWGGQVAYVFGPEDAGLSGEDVNLLDQLVTIPTADYQSLNLAHAVTLLCYEHFRVAAPTVTRERTLGPDAMRALHTAWDDLAAEVETREWRKETSTAVWRKVIGRSLPDTYEVHNIMGILTNTLKRFGHPKYRTPESEKAMKERGLRVSGKADAPAHEPQRAQSSQSEE